jgi:hypothetical protein
VQEKDGYVYVLTRDPDTLYTYEISGLSKKQNFLTYDSPISKLNLNNSGGFLRNREYLYVYGYRDSLEVINIENLAHPKHQIARSDNLSINNMIQHQDYLIAACDRKIAVYLLGDSNALDLLSVFELENDYMAWSAAVYDDILYVHGFVTEDWKEYSYKFKIFDFGDPSNLELIRSIDVTDGGYHLKVVQNWLVDCGTYSVNLWNLNTPTNPVLEFSESAAARVCAFDGNGIVTNGNAFRITDNGLKLITTYDPRIKLSSEEDSVDADGFPYGSVVTEKFIFLAQSPRVLILSADRGSD